MAGLAIRNSVAGDIAAIDRLYPAAFPDDELRPLVTTLLHDTPDVLSLVAVAGAALIGHVAFTSCRVTGDRRAVALLAPLAVAPGWQQRGVGSALVRAGLDRLRADGIVQVFVLGDPGYYRRFGFVMERSVTPPCPVPDAWRDAWQSVRLHDAGPVLHGTLIVPPVWTDPALWAP